MPKRYGIERYLVLKDTFMNYILEYLYYNPLQYAEIQSGWKNGLEDHFTVTKFSL